MKRRVHVLLLMCLLVPGLLAFRPAQAQQLNLSVIAGYNGYFREGHWTPVRVDIRNEGDNLIGEVRVRTGGVSGLAETTYRTPIELPRAARQSLFLYVSLESTTQRIQVEVVDRRQRVVQRASVPLRPVGPGDILFAVVTESPYGAVDLTGLTPGNGRAFQVNWQMDHIPPVAEALAGLDVMLFYDVNTVGLDTASIRNWVASGGHLIIAGGDSWRRTSVGLESLLPVTVQGTQQLNSLAPLAAYLRLPEDPLNDSFIAADSTPLPSAQTLLSVDGVPLIVRQRYGTGTVDFLAVDPTAEPLRSWGERDHLWYTLVSSVGQQPSWADGIRNWDLAREATLTTSSTVLPTLFQLCGFLVLYIALVGPLNYIVLKRLNRREWAWFTIPVFIVLFSVLAYTVGFNLRGNVATVNRLTVVRAWPASDQAQVTALIGVQSPRRTSYTIEVDRGTMLRTLPDIGTGLSLPATITEGTRFVAENIPIDAGTVASFAGDGFIPAPPIESYAVWHLSDSQAPYIEVRFKNTTDLTFEDSIFLIKGASREVGASDNAVVYQVKEGSQNKPLADLEPDTDLIRCGGSAGPEGACDPKIIAPGQVVIVTASIAGGQDPGALTIGNNPIQYGYYYYTPGLPYSYGIGGCFSQPVSATVLDVMLNEPFPCGVVGISNEEQEIRRRYRLLSSLISDSDLSGGRGAGAYLFAWTTEPVVGVQLSGKPQVEEDTTLYIFELPVSAAADTPDVEVPPALTTWTQAAADDPNTLRDTTPNPVTGIRLEGSQQVAFQFRPMPEMQLAEVNELYIKFGGRGALAVSLWDWEQQAWVEIPLDPASETTVVPEPEAFIGPENAVNVRVVSSAVTVSYNQFEYIKVGFRGKLAE